MTDEELLIWLRVEDTNLTDFAADRIEELTAKLAKAVEALEDISGNGNAAGRNPQLMSDKALATLAEIKGESHD